MWEKSIWRSFAEVPKSLLHSILFNFLTSFMLKNEIKKIKESKRRWTAHRRCEKKMKKNSIFVDSRSPYYEWKSSVFDNVPYIYFPWKSVRLLNAMMREEKKRWTWRSFENFFMCSLLWIRIYLDEIESENKKQKGKKCWLKQRKKNTEKMWQKITIPKTFTSLAPLISFLPSFALPRHLHHSATFIKSMTSVCFSNINYKEFKECSNWHFFKRYKNNAENLFLIRINNINFGKKEYLQIWWPLKNIWINK